MLPDLPTHYDTADEFNAALEAIYDFYCEDEDPMRISGFGFWAYGDMETRKENEYGGCQFGKFSSDSHEGIGSIRTRFPLPEIFEIVSDMKARLRKRGRLVSHNSCDTPTHILSIARPGNDKQIWEYGIDATDEEAIRLFLVYGAVELKKL